MPPPSNVSFLKSQDPNCPQAPEAVAAASATSSGMSVTGLGADPFPGRAQESGVSGK